EVLELAARREVFEAREADLYSPPDPHSRDLDGADDRSADSFDTCTRQRPVPPGPVETYVERVAAGGLAAAGVTLAATRSLDRAGQALLIAAPRAARSGRE